MTRDIPRFESFFPREYTGMLSGAIAYNNFVRNHAPEEFDATKRYVFHDGAVRLIPVTKPNVVLADDHALVSSGLQLLLAPVCNIQAILSDGEALVEAVLQLKPDIAIVDFAMPVLNGLEALRQLLGRMGRTRFIIISGSMDPVIATQAMRLGAKAFVLKQSAAEELLASIRSVMNGQTYVTPSLAGPVIEALMNSAEKEPVLTVREREVLQLLAEGKSMKEMATFLNVSPRTVEFHRNNITRKTGLRTIAELSRYASREGLV